MSADVSDRLVDSYHETLTAVVDAGRAVAEDWQSDTVSSSSKVTGPLGQYLRARGLDGELIAMLRTGAEILDTPIQGTPVAAPPYLVVTSRGPICRGTLDNGNRLVLTVSLFRIERRPRRYRFLDPDPAESLTVQIR